MALDLVGQHNSITISLAPQGRVDLRVAENDVVGDVLFRLESSPPVLSEAPGDHAGGTIVARAVFAGAGRSIAMAGGAITARAMFTGAPADNTIIVSAGGSVNATASITGGARAVVVSSGAVSALALLTGAGMARVSSGGTIDAGTIITGAGRVRASSGGTINAAATITGAGDAVTPGPDPSGHPLAYLFSSGEKGAIYDASVMSSLSQDDAGTVPVTASEQTVARPGDLSGNNRHMVQTDPTMRAIYRTTGGPPRLVFDGADDSYELVDMFGVVGATVFTIAFSARIDESPANNIRPFAFHDRSTSAKKTFAAAGDGSLRFDGAAKTSTEGLTPPAQGVDFVRVSQRDGNKVGDWVNGALNIDPVTTVSLAGTTDDLSIGGLTGAKRANLRFYGGLVIDRILTPTERADVEAYFAGLYT